MSLQSRTSSYYPTAMSNDGLSSNSTSTAASPSFTKSQKFTSSRKPVPLSVRTPHLLSLAKSMSPIRRSAYNNGPASARTSHSNTQAHSGAPISARENRNEVTSMKRPAHRGTQSCLSIGIAPPPPARKKSQVSPIYPAEISTVSSIMGGSFLCDATFAQNISFMDDFQAEEIIKSNYIAAERHDGKRHSIGSSLLKSRARKSWSESTAAETTDSNQSLLKTFGTPPDDINKKEYLIRKLYHDIAKEKKKEEMVEGMVKDKDKMVSELVATIDDLKNANQEIGIRLEVDSHTLQLQADVKSKKNEVAHYSKEYKSLKEAKNAVLDTIDSIEAEEKRIIQQQKLFKEKLRLSKEKESYFFRGVETMQDEIMLAEREEEEACLHVVEAQQRGQVDLDEKDSIINTYKTKVKMLRSSEEQNETILVNTKKILSQRERSASDTQKEISRTKNEVMFVKKGLKKRELDTRKTEALANKEKHRNIDLKKRRGSLTVEIESQRRTSVTSMQELENTELQILSLDNDVKGADSQLKECLKIFDELTEETTAKTEIMECVKKQAADAEEMINMTLDRLLVCPQLVLHSMNTVEEKLRDNAILQGRVEDMERLCTSLIALEETENVSRLIYLS
eukprot:GHVL01003668.1.p1 GENE.GHVL01003668.1~~GHVL01003668.1.p1  ORF type:complete len:623 (+),score=115.11 GHVL01003668.1:73-1941(+)